MNLTIAAIDFDRIDYDREADVLYLSTGDPAKALDFQASPDGHALRFDADGRLVGITIVVARRLVDEGRDVHVQAPRHAHRGRAGLDRSVAAPALNGGYRLRPAG